MLGVPRCCSAFLMAIKNLGRAIEHFFCLKFPFDAKVSNSMLCMHSAGAYETLEMLDGMLDLTTLSRPAQSKAEQKRANLYAVR